jgi:hypothetical protein
MSVRRAKRNADIVFAGRVEEITTVDSKGIREPRIIIRFSVARVWKGPVTSSFEMHTNREFSSCAGFYREFLEPGRTLIVYGYGAPAIHWKDGRIGGAPGARSLTLMGDDRSGPLRSDLIDAVPDDQIVYSTNICTRTGPVEHAVEDFDRLGKPRVLGELHATPDRALVESLKREPNGLPERRCWELADGKKWRRLMTPPPNYNELVALFESEDNYSDIPNPRPTRYRDQWVTNADGAFGLCRTSVNKDIACGEGWATFVRDPKSADTWEGAEGQVWTHCDLHPATKRP